MVLRNISQEKAELSALIAMVRKGDEVIPAKSGKPVAKVVPFGGISQNRVPGSMEGEIRIAPDFDRLPDDIAEAFGMLGPGKWATIAFYRRPRQYGLCERSQPLRDVAQEWHLAAILLT